MGGKDVGRTVEAAAADDDDSDVSAVDIEGGGTDRDEDDDVDEGPGARMAGHRRRPECDGDETNASVATANTRAM
jgi:hypothetical protein